MDEQILLQKCSLVLSNASKFLPFYKYVIFFYLITFNKKIKSFINTIDKMYLIKVSGKNYASLSTITFFKWVALIFENLVLISINMINPINIIWLCDHVRYNEITEYLIEERNI